MDTFKFDVEELKKALVGTELIIDEIEDCEEIGIVYISFYKNNLSYIKVAKEYEGRNNCINIYHGESTKNGFWWNNKINYKELVKELLLYSNSKCV